MQTVTVNKGQFCKVLLTNNDFVKNQNVKLDVSCKNNKCTYDNWYTISKAVVCFGKWSAMMQIMHTF